MELIGKVFDSALILKRRSRVDDRGVMTVVNDESIDGFRVKETRMYSMNTKGTFFGIHYRDEEDPMNRMVSVIKGRGMDYLVDLRKDSPTYLKWEKLELTEENALAVLVPSGIGHAFQSLEENTILSYSMDKSGKDGYTKTLNHLEGKIGLQLEMPVAAISDYDIAAPYL